MGHSVCLSFFELCALRPLAHVRVPKKGVRAILVIATSDNTKTRRRETTTNSLLQLEEERIHFNNRSPL